MNIFNISHRSKKNKARRGVVTLAHGTAQTPGFMSIGTAGTVKSLTVGDLQNLGAEIILGNTYHLWLKPDLEVLTRAGGLHKFGQWTGPILTDSGGFQAFSLGDIRTLTEDGVTFKVPSSGDLRFLSPEKSMQIQTVIGSDVALVLDELLPAEVSKEQAKQAMLRTRRWAERSKIEFQKLKEDSEYLRITLGLEEVFTPNSVQFGIPQGAQFEDLRKESALLTMELDFPGYSVGGVANGGEPEEVMYSQVLAQTEVLEDEKPRHLLGVGTPKDIVQMVARGIDLFDCVYPTRNARHGSLIFEVDDSSYEEVQITSKRYEFDFSPINSSSTIPELRLYSKAYLRHLLKAKELLGMRLATLQNLDFYYRLMEKIRNKIEDSSFDDWWVGYRRV
jgi:queuine tRNA-ribosyltransferase